MATGILAATIASAQNGFSGPGLYEIMNLKSSRMMALDMKDRTSVIQIVSHSQEEQRWIVEPGFGTFASSATPSTAMRSRLQGREKHAGGVRSRG